MYTVEYKNFFEISKIIKSSFEKDFDFKFKKNYSDYDLFIIYDTDDSFVGAFTDDLGLAKTVRRMLSESTINQNIFTQSIRCVIIRHKDYSKCISLENLTSRYSIKI